MKTIGTRNITATDLCRGEFNNGEHLFLECEPCKYQTISVKLPNDEFITFAFVPGEAGEMECVDIHSTVGQKFRYKETDDASDVHFVQHAIGFSRNGDTFDTRQADKPTGLMTVLLGKHHHRLQDTTTAKT